MTNPGVPDTRSREPHAPAAVVRVADQSVSISPGQTVTVGRGSRCALACVDPRVSRTHLTIRCYGDGRVEVEDAGTTNGTFSYGRPVTRETVTGTTVYALGDPDGPVLSVLVRGASPDPALPQPITGEEGIPLTVGRSADNSLVLEDPLVSRYHARLVRRGPGYDVVDLASRNGVHVNGVPVTAASLRPGDRLTIGRTTFHTLDGTLLPATEKDAALIVHDVSYALPTGTVLLDAVSISVPSASLLAVIGPSGAGKSTLLRALTGSTPATSGQVLYAGVDLYRHFASFRQRIGVVPQDDVVHRQLTVRRCLDYAAELRLPRDYTRQARDAEVDRVLAELGLTEHAHTQIARLSGGQRKRTSVALELLNQPSLLILDEPTSGLDPHLDRSIMTLLRHQADSGRIVVVVTHSVAHLAVCDNVLVLAPGGKVAYFGSPRALLGHFQVSDYADVFRRVTEDPAGCAQAFAALHERPPRARDPLPQEPVVQAAPRGQRLVDQWSTLLRRQARVVLSDRSYAVATLVLPLALALMALAIPGSTGFGRPAPDALGEPSQLLVILLVGAAFMGLSLSIRELVAERAIFLRERAVGLSPPVYLLAKFCALTILAAVQSVLFVGVVLLRKPAPPSASLLGNGTVELVLAVFGTALASAAIGFFLSSLVGTSEQTMPVLVVAVMAQLVLCGGLITVTGRPVMEALATVLPSRWGYAQGASTIDLRSLNPTAQPDRLWEHTPSTWALAAGALTLITTAALLAATVLLTRRKASV